MNVKQTIGVAAFLAALAVILGAFGAHAFQAKLVETGRAATYETAVKYHFYHALGLFLVAILSQQFQQKLQLVKFLLVIGIIIFSGSLYLLCATGITWLGAITPIGGASLIAAWLLLAWNFIKKS
jgi:uncharacterized membrane protein YgdD (TMEM256/DUF423 family)